MAWGSPAWYAALHQDIDIQTLDLKTAEHQQILHQHLSHSDLLLTSSRPAALTRLSLDWPTLSRQYPRLCQVAIVGQLPPNENVAGHDLTYQAGVGLVQPPQMPPTTLADLAGAERAAQAALALLLARERGQGAGYEMVSLAATADFYAQPLRHGLTTPDGPLGGGLPGYGIYQAQAGWVAVAALEPHFLARLKAELGLTEVSHEALADAFSAQTAVFWAQCGRPNEIYQ